MVIMFYLNNLCSLCLAQNKKFTSRSGLNSNAKDMLECIIPEFIQQKSGIPRKICDDCLSSFAAVFKFRQKCLGNMNIFDEYVRKLQPEYGLYKHLAVTITNVKLDIKKEIDREGILDEDTGFFEEDMRTDCLKLEDIKQEPSEEQEENDQKIYVVLGIKKEISEEIILDENTRNDVVLSASYECDIKNTDENQDVDCDESAKCTKCGKEFHNRMRDIGSSKCQKCQTISAPNKSKKVRFAKKSHVCNTCNKSFRRIISLKRHELLHTAERPFSCNICGKRFLQFRYEKAHQRVHTNNTKKPYVCNICEKAFPDSAHLRSHSLSHSDKRSFECDVCQKWFKSFHNLRTHKAIHSAVREHECEVCKKRFSLKSSMMTHKQIHSEKKRFQCNLCEKNFTRSKYLKVHIETHSNETPYECSICKKRFKIADYLRLHKIKHTELKLFKCNVCNKTFATNYLLKGHQNFHTKPYSCPICKNNFPSLSSLECHKIIHTEERPFPCDVCPKKFRRVTDLKEHKRIHDGIKPFRCGVCEKPFRSSGQRTQHEKSQHKEKFETAQESVIASHI